jgi:hypothetical protein
MQVACHDALRHVMFITRMPHCNITTQTCNNHAMTHCVIALQDPCQQSQG